MKLTKTERVLAQLTSGRWILTVMAGTAFFGFCVAIALVVYKSRTQFKPETIVAMFSAALLVIQGVYKDYFARDRNGHLSDENNGNGDKPPTDEVVEPVEPDGDGQ